MYFTATESRASSVGFASETLELTPLISATAIFAEPLGRVVTAIESTTNRTPPRTGTVWRKTVPGVGAAGAAVAAVAGVPLATIPASAIGSRTTAARARSAFVLFMLAQPRRHHGRRAGRRLRPTRRPPRPPARPGGRRHK